MKKILTSLFVIFTFAFYVFYQRSQDANLALNANQTQLTDSTAVTPQVDSSIVTPQTQPVVPPTPTAAPLLPPPIITAGREDDGEGEDDGRVRVRPPTQVVTQPAPTPQPTPAPTTPPTPTTKPIVTTPPVIKPKGMYADGSYVGNSADAYYGFVQVKAVVSGGRITDVVFLNHPQDRQTSRDINNQAMPYLRQEAIQAQSANVNIVSGATDTSMAFRESLGIALAKAKI